MTLRCCVRQELSFGVPMAGVRSTTERRPMDPSIYITNSQKYDILSVFVLRNGFRGIWMLWRRTWRIMRVRRRRRSRTSENCNFPSTTTLPRARWVDVSNPAYCSYTDKREPHQAGGEGPVLRAVASHVGFGGFDSWPGLRPLLPSVFLWLSLEWLWGPGRLRLWAR